MARGSTRIIGWSVSVRLDAAGRLRHHPGTSNNSGEATIRILRYCLCFAFAGVNFAWADNPLVVIDHQYDTELVKMACIPKMEPACVDEKLKKLAQFEEAVRASLASEPKCGGVTIAGNGDHPGPYWELLIDSNSQSFRLMRLHEESNFTNYTATGTAPVIAEKVCTMATKKKAS
jgi:hypothetical protein